MKCSCQAQCPDNAKFCHSCGREFKPTGKRRGSPFEVSDDKLRLSKDAMRQDSALAYDALSAKKLARALFEVSEDKLRLSKDAMRQESALAYDALSAKKLTRALIGFGIGLAIAVPLAVTAFFAKEHAGAHVGLALLPLGAGLGWAYFTTRFYSGDYYSLPHSRDASGGHRCVWCGGRGIWRKGEYRSDVTYANCSSCKTLLFNE